jgi:glycerophosphoryl diester phosphodiesterase
MPENTIESMKKALDIGVDVLEIDVVISKDRLVVVSHDPYMDYQFCLKPGGDTMTPAEGRSIVLYSMPYSEIKKYDVGTKRHPHFPEQEHFRAYKPLMGELFDSTDAYARRKGIPLPRYNIEIKSNPKTDGFHQPAPEEFVKLVLDVCRSKNVMKRMNIQSFDARPLQVIRRIDPEVQLAYLVSNTKTVEENLETLGFTPEIYSPNHAGVNKNVIKECHDRGMKVIPWTVNSRNRIKELIVMGADGIITDYPNYFH